MKNIIVLFLILFSTSLYSFENRTYPEDRSALLTLYITSTLPYWVLSSCSKVTGFSHFKEEYNKWKTLNSETIKSSNISLKYYLNQNDIVSMDEFFLESESKLTKAVEEHGAALCNHFHKEGYFEGELKKEHPKEWQIMNDYIKKHNLQID